MSEIPERPEHAVVLTVADAAKAAGATIASRDDLDTLERDIDKAVIAMRSAAARTVAKDKASELMLWLRGFRQ